MAEAGSVLVRIRGDNKSAMRAIGQTNKAMGGMEKRSGALSSSLAGVGRVLGKTAKVGAFALAGVGAATGAVGLKFAAMEEQAGIAFETMLGSGKKAQSFLGELKDFAATTPFEFPELTKSAQKLLAMGFSAEETLPTLTAIGDAVSGLGGGSAEIDSITRALGQMRAKGKVSAEEMMQLNEIGIPAWEMLAKTLNTDVATAMDMVTKRQVDATKAVPALVKQMDKKFGGLMKKQSKSVSGLWSTIKDQFQQGAASLVEPMLPGLKKSMKKVVKFGEQFLEAKGFRQKLNVIWWGVTKVARELASKIAEKVRAIDWNRWLRGAIQIGGDALTMAQDFGQKVTDAMVRAIQNMDTNAIVDKVNSVLRSVMENAATSFARVVEVFEQIRQPLADMIVKLLASVALTLTDVTFWAKNWKLAAALFLRFGTRGLSGVIGRLGGFLGTKLVKVFGKAFGPVGRVLAQGVVKAIGFMWRALRSGFSRLPGLIRSLLRTGLILSVIQAVERAVKAIGDGAKKIAGQVSKWASQAKKIGTGVIKGIASTIKSLPGKMANWLGQALKHLIAAGPKALRMAKTIGTNIANGIKSALSKIWDVMMQIVKWIWDGIQQAISQAFNAALGIGKAIADGIISGIGDLAGRLAGSVWSKVKGGLGGLAGKLGIGSPSKYTKKKIGIPIAQGIVLGAILGLNDFPGKLSDKVVEALNKASGKARSLQNVMRNAFARVATRAMEAFDARVDRELNKLDAKLEAALEGIESTRSAPTAAEAEIARLEALRNQEQATRDLADAQANLDKVLADPDATADDRIDAQRRLDDVLLDQKLATLQETARIEREAADAAAEAQVKAAEEAAALERKHKEVQLGIEREAMERRLRQLEAGLANGTTTWKKAHKTLMGLFSNEFGPDFETAGADLGEAFVTSLKKSLNNAAKTARAFGKAIAKALAAYLKLKSPADKGPLSDLDKWWKPFNSTISKGLDEQGLAANVAAASVARSGAAGGAAGAGAVVNIQVGTLVGTDGMRQLSEVIYQELAKKGRREGALWTNVPGLEAA